MVQSLLFMLILASQHYIYILIKIETHSTDKLIYFFLSLEQFSIIKENIKSALRILLPVSCHLVLPYFLVNLFWTIQLVL